MKERKTLIIVLVVLLIGLLGVGGFFIMQNNQNANKKDPKTEEKEKENKGKEEKTPETEVKLSQEQITIEDNSQQAICFDAIRKMGVEVFEADKYKTYEKKNGAYFINLNQFASDFGYDISIFKGEDGTECNKELSGVYFDNDHVLRDDYGDDAPAIVPILVGCSQAELQQQPQQ